MLLLNLAYQVGINPIKVSGTQGGEYHSSCPLCGGTDRFFIQPNRQMKNCIGYYCCRQCGISGDAIQFAMDFKHMDFKKATEYLGVIIPYSPLTLKTQQQKKFKPNQVIPSSDLWLTKASSFVAWTHEKIWNQQSILEMLHKRGLTDNAIKRYKIGFNPHTINPKKQDWGINELGTVWIPKGIVIPSFSSNLVLRIKIRRTNIHSGKKYVVLSGSTNGLTLAGRTSNSLMIVVESELDAYAIEDALGDLACIVGVGSNIKNPDNIIHFLAKKKELLICHDNDDAGNTMWKKWKKLYPHAISYPAPLGKDIGESIEQRVSIRPWILRYKWNNTIEENLIDFILQYCNKYGSTIPFYKNIEKNILLGPEKVPTSFIDNLKLMQDLIKKEVNF